MMARRGLPLIAAAILLGGCSPSATINYKMIVEIDDNGTIRQGSSVWQFKITKNSWPGTGYAPKWRGEAVAVDIPGRGTLFVLGKDQAKLVENKFRQDAEALHGRNQPRHVINQAIAKFEGQSKALHCPELYPSPIRGRNEMWNDCPFMATFGDPSVPASVIEVNPADLEAAFGRGVKLKRISLEITDGRVTTGITERLPWLEKYRERGVQFDGQKHGSFGADASLSALLGPGHFSTELD